MGIVLQIETIKEIPGPKAEAQRYLVIGEELFKLLSRREVR